VSRDSAAIADALLTLLGNPEELAAMGAAGCRYWQENFTVEHVANWHVSLYDELRRTGPRHRPPSRRHVKPHARDG
jgi:glycosyltransferase involved in cell wall biosynthesis